MFPRIISPKLVFSPQKLVPIFIILVGFTSGCSTALQNISANDKFETPQNTVEEIFTPASQGLESEVPQNSVKDAVQTFSSDQLGLCFSYPQGYTQIPYEGSVEIVAPDHLTGLFWLEISDSYDRSAMRIADEDMTIAFSQGVPRANLGWWSITIDGEEAVVLDGMPGQDLQRRVYVVRDQTLYILAFMPTLSENQATNDQMENLYNMITSSWSWSACSGRE